MARVHSRADIYAVCEDVLRDESVLSRRRIQLKLRERCAEMGLPEAGATNALVDSVIAELMSNRRAAAAPGSLSADPTVAAVELPQALTEALSRNAEVVTRIYQEGIVLAARRAEAAGRALLEVAESENFHRASRFENELAHSTSERAGLAEELDAALDALSASQTQAREIGVLLETERDAATEWQRRARDQIAELEEDVRAAHAARCTAEASKQVVEIELSRLGGAYEILIAACARAEGQLAALYWTVSMRDVSATDVA